MPGSGGEAFLQSGRHALERADWESARSAFRAALARDGGPAALDGLARAEWFLGRVPAAVALREQAFGGHVRAGRCAEAVRAAVWVAHQHQLGGRSSAARGWLARAGRVLADVPPCAAHGWVAVERARQAGTVVEQADAASRALEVARGTRDADLEVLAISVLGRAAVRAGRREAGLRLLEEAMAAAAAGQVRDVHTLGEAWCNLLLGCSAAQEWTRAAEWCDQVAAFAAGRRIAPLFGACCAVHAQVLLAAGRWSEADRALQTALAHELPHLPEVAAPALAALAELRVRQGRTTEAERLLADRPEHPAGLRALALVRLAQGRAAPATALLHRGLRAAADDSADAAALLEPLVEARLAAGDLPGARVAAGALSGVAERTGTGPLAARADLAAARVHLAAGPPADAAEPARRALAGFDALRMPVDAALARLVWAQAVAADDPATAAEEVHAARAVLRAVGAAPAADAATELLRTCTGTRARGTLTAREEEVLELITRGLSNAGIARALVISEKTAGHHVSHILAKLGARNRAEAAARAVRRPVPDDQPAAGHGGPWRAHRPTGGHTDSGGTTRSAR